MISFALKITFAKSSCMGVVMSPTVNISMISVRQFSVEIMLKVVTVPKETFVTICTLLKYKTMPRNRDLSCVSNFKKQITVKKETVVLINTPN